MYTNDELKLRGKEAFKRNYGMCVLVALILSFLIAGNASGSNLSSNSEKITLYQSSTADDRETPSFSLSYRLPRAVSLGQSTSDIMQGEDTDSSEDSYTRISISIGPLVFGFTSVLFGLIFLVLDAALMIFVFNPVSVGCRRFFWQNLKGDAELSEMGFAYKNNWKGIGIGLFTTDIVTMLWYLLLIIPGIVKSYAYMLVPYLMAEYPDMTGSEARAESERLMDGHKGDAFLFGLSFIGWDILSVLTLGLAGIFYVNPYKYSSYAVWYETMKEIDAEKRARNNSLNTAQIPELVSPYEGDRTE